MRSAYDLPGSSLLTVQLPYVNSLTAGIVGDPSPLIRGTNPASSARDALAAYVPQNVLVPGISGPKQGLFDMSAAGKVVTGVLVGLVLLAIGVWVVVRQ